MKKLYILIVFIHSSVFSQISNPGFEIIRDTAQSLPASWKAKMPDHFGWKIDTAHFYSGKQSLMMENQLNKDSLQFSPFSQTCPVTIDRVKKIYLTVYIKTENVSHDAGLWCQLWDKNNTSVGFTSLQVLNIKTSGTRNWTKYSIALTVSPEIKKLLLGGFLKGTGTVWYDDFKIEEAPEDKITSKKAIKFINQVVDITKNNSIVADSLNWEGIRKDMLSLAYGAQTTSECYETVNYLLTQLRKKGDNHSNFYPPAFNKKNKTINIDGRTPSGSYLGNSIGYINVPGFTSINKKIGIEFATAIQSLIRTIDSAHAIESWIVDLRENTGGNMYPMIAGLGPLIGEGKLGYFYSPKNKNEYAWQYKNGAAGAGITTICKVENPYTLKNNHVKVIVLTGYNTASSGEMTLISFKGKENTTVMGMPTAGYSTGNGGHSLSDGSMLNLCESYCRDRNKKSYFGKIEPDEIIADDPGSEGDNLLEYAKKHLSK